MVYIYPHFQHSSFFLINLLVHLVSFPYSLMSLTSTFIVKICCIKNCVCLSENLPSFLKDIFPKYRHLS